MTRGALCIDQADVVLFLRLLQSDVLSDEHTDADTRHVESIKELVDVREVVEADGGGELFLEFCYAHCHDGNDVSMSGVNVL